jgi:hypothetical protein
LRDSRDNGKSVGTIEALVLPNIGHRINTINLGLKLEGSELEGNYNVTGIDHFPEKENPSYIILVRAKKIE